MKHQRMLLWFGVFALLGLLPLLSSPALTDSGVEPRELPWLRETPEIPVGSIVLRRHFPEHPGRSQPPRPSGGCDKDVDLTSTISGVVAIAAQDNKICTSSDIDTYVAGTKTYVVQAGGQEAAWIHTDVTTPSSPVIRGSFKWLSSSTYTPDVKTFNQTEDTTGTTRYYIALSLERLSSGGICGVVIVDVTNPSDPILVTQIYKNDPGDFWCDVHNSSVEDDPNGSGEGRYIYLTADARNDMRVLDIGNLSLVEVGSTCDIADGTCPITEVGRYTSPTANNDNYVHDVTVINHGGTVGRRAYLAYWDTGLVILNAADVTPNANFDINPIPLVGPNKIDPPSFLTHHAFASQDGSLVFIQDEFLNTNGGQPVQMWEFSNPANPTRVDGLVLGTDVPVNPPHNLEIRFDIDPNRLYVGWYKLGLQAFDFDSTGFMGRALYHQVQTEPTDDVYDGSWGVRLENIGTNLYIFQSDRRYGLIVDKVLSGCTTNEDCNDANECTTDTCGADEVCSNTAVADGTTCNTGTGLCCGGLCTTPSCTAGADCDDGEACTTDSCLNAGTCSATCSNTWVCPTCLLKGASCSIDAKCCSNKCRGRSGNKTCR